MKLKIETPPILSGTAEQQLKVVYSYLFRMSENLNVALSDLDGGGGAYGAGSMSYRSVNDGTQPNGGLESAAKAYNELRALIGNTAEIIRSEMDLIEVQLNSEYSALSSQWGTFSGEFERYKVETSGYIKSGFIDYDEYGVPIIGVAIGQNLKSVTVTMPDGSTLEQIDSTQNCAFYTADRLYFRVNGQEIAYLSNSKLYIRNAEITGKVVLGGKWELSSHNGFTIKWIGG